MGPQWIWTASGYAWTFSFATYLLDGASPERWGHTAVAALICFGVAAILTALRKR